MLIWLQILFSYESHWSSHHSPLFPLRCCWSIEVWSWAPNHLVLIYWSHLHIRILLSNIEKHLHETSGDRSLISFWSESSFLSQKIFLHCKMILFPLSFVCGGGLLVLEKCGTEGFVCQAGNRFSIAIFDQVRVQPHSLFYLSYLIFHIL